MQGIGQNIRKHRERQELSQTELAQRCGWNGNTRVSNYEKDDRNVSVSNLFILADALQISVLDLLPEKAVERIKGPNFAAHLLNEDAAEYQKEASANSIRLNRLINDLESKGALSNQLTNSLITLLSAYT